MTKAKISQYDAVAANNTDVNGVNIAEGCPPSSMNNMGREIMAALKRFETGADGDSLTVGGSLVVSNTLTAGPVSATTLNTSGAVVFNDAGADVDFRVEGDTDANLLFVDASADKVGIGTNAPSSGYKLHVAGNSYTNGNYFTTGNNTGIFFTGSATNFDYGVGRESSGLTFYSGSINPIAVIDSSGNLLVGTTTNYTSSKLHVSGANSNFTTSTSSTGTTGWYGVNLAGSVGAINVSRNGSNVLAFFHTSNANGINGASVGTISITTTATSYNTSSDYRLKENIAPMTGALAKVLELKPVTYTWKANGSTGEGFIAHELQAVCPDAVTGEKDGTEIRQVEVSPAVPATYDEEGNELTPAVEAVYEEREVPKYQGVDTSFLVATLTAAIQELSAKNDALEARIAALENA